MIQYDPILSDVDYVDVRVVFWLGSTNGLVKQVGGVSANEIIKLNPWVLEMQKRYWTSKTLCGLHLLHSLRLLGCKPTNSWILLVIKRDLSVAKIKSTIENEVPLLQLAFHNVFQCSSMGSFWKDMTTCPHHIGIYTESTKNQDSNQRVWLVDVGNQDLVVYHCHIHGIIICSVPPQKKSVHKVPGRKILTIYNSRPQTFTLPMIFQFPVGPPTRRG